MPTRDEILVSTAWLAEHLHDPDVRVIDGRFYLPDGDKTDGRAEYLEGHIPGAVHLDWLRDFSDPNDPVEGQIAPPERFREVMEAAGIDDDTLVVTYDDNAVMMGARLWWALRYYGHDAVRILDGGLNRWIAEGRTLELRVPSYPRGHFTPRVRPELRVTREDVLREIGAPNRQILDCRMDSTYEAAGAHIPGARRLPGPRFVVDGTWRPTEEIAADVAAAGPRKDAERIVVYCGGGVSATGTLAALTMLGYDNVSLYDGSWTEWGADPTTPKETHAPSAG